MSQEIVTSSFADTSRNLSYALKEQIYEFEKVVDSLRGFMFQFITIWE